MNITVFADGWSYNFLSELTSQLNSIGTHRFHIFRPYENENIVPSEKLEIAGLEYNVSEVGKYDLAVYHRDSKQLFNNTVPGASVATPEHRLTSYLMHVQAKLRAHVEKMKSQGMLVFQPIKADRIWASMVMRAMAMPVININPEPFPDFYWLDHMGPQHTGFLSTVENWHRIKRLKFTEFEEKEFAEWRERFETGEETRGRDWLDDRLSCGLEDAPPFVLIIGQMRTDANQFMYQRNIDYDPVTLAKVIELVSNDFKIYYKPHPLEREQDHLEWESLPEKVRSRITIVNPKSNLHPYLKSARAVFTWNSNAGIEALAYHKPLCVLGEAFYRNKGFTFDVDFLTPRLLEHFMLEWTPDTEMIDQYLKFMVTRFLISTRKDGWGDRFLERINGILMDTVKYTI